MSITEDIAGVNFINNFTHKELGMRLLKFINEDVIVNDESDIAEIGDLIIRDCKPFLKEFNIAETLFYRGTSKRRGDMVKLSPRQDRMPKDMDYDLYNYLDEWSMENFGWKWRSQGVFTMDNKYYADQYGTETHIFFPIGRYKYLYHPKVSDIMDIVPAYEYVEQFDAGDQSDPFAYRQGKQFDKMLYGYKDKGLARYAHKSDNSIEVVWYCKEYYLVHTDHLRDVREYILRG